MRAPFNQMVKNLERIASHASAADRKFIGLSAGVNWRTPETSVVRLLKRELDLAMTSRNYGNAGGTPAVTRTLESLENHTHHCRGLAVTLVHGTTEGSSLALDCWASSSVLQAGGKALMIGHAFPLYHRLSTDRKLDFHECLGDEANSHSFLPSELAITESLEQLKPKVIFLLLPNNPLGEIINPASLARIVDYVRAHDARLLVDRVCLMPWDAPKLVRDLLGPLVFDVIRYRWSETIDNQGIGLDAVAQSAPAYASALALVLGAVALQEPQLVAHRAPCQVQLIGRLPDRAVTGKTLQRPQRLCGWNARHAIPFSP